MDGLSLFLFAVVAFIGAAMGYTVGRSVGQKEGYERGVGELGLHVGPYTLAQKDHLEVGYTVQIVVKGKPVLQPIDTIVEEVPGQKFDKHELTKQSALALGMAAKMVEKARAGGLAAKLVEPKK